eukprot:5021746-Amphidinium_carterae.1
MKVLGPTKPLTGWAMEDLATALQRCGRKEEQTVVCLHLGVENKRATFYRKGATGTIVLKKNRHVVNHSERFWPFYLSSACCIGKWELEV